jgi:hypothetical protein
MANGTQTVDLTELAKKYGGKPAAQATPQATKPLIDLAALAAKHGGKPVAPSTPTAPQNPVHKDRPFTAGAYDAFGLNAEKIVPMTDKGVMGTVKGTGEALKETGENIGKWIVSSSNDPLHIPDPMMAMGNNLKDSFKEVKEGLEEGNHEKLMHGLGLATGTLAPILADKVPGMAKGVSFAAKDISAQRAIVSAASHGALDNLRDEHSAAIDTAVKAEKARIGGNVAALNTKDLAADPSGFKPSPDKLAEVDKAVLDKKANVMLSKNQLSKVAQLRSLVEGYVKAKPKLTFDDLKQIRTVIGDLNSKATSGLEGSILSDLYKSSTNELKARSIKLNGLNEWNDYNETTEKVSGHEKGLIPELKDSKTGLEYAKKISSEQNQGRLSTLESDLKLPKDFFKKTVKDYKPITNFAKMTEGDSLQAKLTNRLIALKGHPIVATMGAAAGGAAGRALGTSLGMPLVGTFAGVAFGADIAHSLLSKYDAAKAIRDIGGPSGVMGVRSQAPPSSTASSSTGPGGGGSTPPTAPPVSNTPSGSPPSAPSAGLSEEGPSLAEKAIKEGYNKEYDKPVDRRQNLELRKALDKLKDKPNEALEHFRKATEAARKSETKATPAEIKTESKVTKAPPEAASHATKDAERMRKGRASGKYASQTSGGDIVSKAEAMKKPGGKITTGGVEDIPLLESKLAEQYPKLGGKKFVAKFRRALDETYGKDYTENNPEHYKTYLAEAVEKRAAEIAKDEAIEAKIPGLKKD